MQTLSTVIIDILQLCLLSSLFLLEQVLLVSTIPKVEAVATVAVMSHQHLLIYSILVPKTLSSFFQSFLFSFTLSSVYSNLLLSHTTTQYF